MQSSFKFAFSQIIIFFNRKYNIFVFSPNSNYYFITRGSFLI